MSKVINSAQPIIGNITGHKYTGLTVKLPFINLSFAPVHTISPTKGCF